ncbi:MAG: amidohydrolase [Cellulosilyticum sp.]|nr:amidohydrolase [Cellulosilyticum sp.]
MRLIKNGKILTMAGKSYEKGCVLIEGSKIKQVAEHIEETPDMEVIDVKGGWVMPGIIEAHCHVGITEEKKGIEGDDCNEMTNPVTPFVRAIDGINTLDVAFDDAVRAGITSIMVGPGSANVVGGQFVFMKTKGRVIDELVVKHPAAMKVAFGENPKREYGGQQKMPCTRMAIAALLREEIFKAKQYLKKKEAGNEDFETDFRLEPWIPVLKREIPLKAHVHRADDILTAIRIAKEFNLLMTLDHCSEGYLIPEEVARSGYPAIVGPALTTRNKIEVQNVSFKTPGILAKEGTKIAITTDHPVTPVQYLPKCAGFAVRDGLSLEDGLKAITINAAEICGVSDRVGSLEVGKDADIAVFDDNPMQTLTHTLYTFINGEVAYSHEHVHTPKETC